MSLLPPRATKKKSQWKKGVSGNPKGNPPGYKKKRTIGREKIAASRFTPAEMAKLMPLDFALDILRHPTEYSLTDRQWAAHEAMPYLHRKMPIAIEGGDRPIGVIDAGKLTSMKTEELERLATIMATLGVAINDAQKTDE